MAMQWTSSVRVWLVINFTGHLNLGGPVAWVAMLNFPTYVILTHEVTVQGGETEIKVGVEIINKLIVKNASFKTLDFH